MKPDPLMTTFVAPAPAITDVGESEVTTGTALFEGCGVGALLLPPPPHAAIIRTAKMDKTD
jgi:hypothetical protein